MSLVGAMLLGRVFCGLLDGLCLCARLHLDAVGGGVSFVTCLPGIVLQLAAIPLVTLALRPLCHCRQSPERARYSIAKKKADRHTVPASFFIVLVSPAG